jgi:hypothetical protein
MIDKISKKDMMDFSKKEQFKMLILAETIEKFKFIILKNKFT